jgi:hypothetical protein
MSAYMHTNLVSSNKAVRCRHWIDHIITIEKYLKQISVRDYAQLSRVLNSSIHRVIQKEVYTFKNLFYKNTDAKSMSCVRMEKEIS